jgi:hypothetical protein
MVKKPIDHNWVSVEIKPITLEVPLPYTKKGFRLTHLSHDPIVIWHLDKALFVLGSNSEPQPHTLANIFDHFLHLTQPKAR